MPERGLRASPEPQVSDGKPSPPGRAAQVYFPKEERYRGQALSTRGRQSEDRETFLPEEQRTTGIVDVKTVRARHEPPQARGESDTGLESTGKLK